MGQHDRAANLLIGMLGIDAQPDGHFDRLVEFGAGRLLDDLHRLFRVVQLILLDKLESFLVFLTVFRHW